MTGFEPGAKLVNLVLLGLLTVLLILSLNTGPVALGWQTVLAALSPVSDPAELSAAQLREYSIVTSVRLPRTLLALLVGAALGGAGAALQGLLRNPLAEPGLLGVSASAALGAVLCLYFGLAYQNVWWLPVCAMGGAALATLLLQLLLKRNASPLSLILAGVALSSLAAALTSLAINLSPDPHDVQDIVLWLLGSLNGRSFEDLYLCLPFVAVGLILLLLCGRALDALTLGEDEAASLGVGLSALYLQVVIGAALCVGSTVAVTGTIGFVGLVVPHLLRPLVGARPSRLILSSMLGGAVLLLLADMLTRVLIQGSEIMLGVVTALIGAPFFFLLVLRNSRELNL
ncbi:iron ABC transporter permease [Granulosicoccaceae sp. 1_MG-2023]|nr:iron ABC transporter permease [Granulosicoccaceae sp. 1_MG-2023]